MTLEAVILVPIFLILMLLIIAGARVGMAGNAINSAASAAAREASLSTSTAAAQYNARLAAETSIANSGYNCASLNVAINDAGINAPLGQIGTVSATVTCDVNLQDLTAVPGLPGVRTLEATASSPVDAFRERE